MGVKNINPLFTGTCNFSEIHKSKPKHKRSKKLEKMLNSMSTTIKDQQRTLKNISWVRKSS